MGSTSLFAPTTDQMRDHWVWRPEWTPERTCLYWYLTFRPEQVATLLGEDSLRVVREADWLDAIPPQWWHVTVADVGFTDELDPTDVERTTAAVIEALTEEQSLQLVLGPVQTFASALVLAAGPLDRLRAVKLGIRRATADALGERHADVHRALYWPHLSLGYTNRAVDAATAADLVGRLPTVSAEVAVDAVTLAAVTRRDRGYRWQVAAQVDLRPPSRH